MRSHVEGGQPAVSEPPLYYERYVSSVIVVRRYHRHEA